MNVFHAFLIVPLTGALITSFLPDSKPGLAGRAAALFSAAAFLMAALTLIPDDRMAPSLALLTQGLLRAPAAVPAFVAGQLAALACVTAPVPFGAAAKPGRYYALLLAAQAALGGIFYCSGWLLLLFWTLSAAASWLLLRTGGARSGAFGIYHALSCALCALGVAGLAFQQPGPWPNTALMAAAAIRMGAFPLQSWVKPAHADSGAAHAAFLSGPLAASGLYLFALACSTAEPQTLSLASWAMLAALFYSPLAALAQTLALPSLAFISAAGCALFALTAALGSPSAVSAALLGCAAQTLAPALAALKISQPRSVANPPLLSMLALAGAPPAIVFAALFIAAALLFSASIYLAAAAFMALALNASAIYALPSKTAPCPSAGSGSVAGEQLAVGLLALATLAGGLFPLLPPMLPPF